MIYSLLKCSWISVESIWIWISSSQNWTEWRYSIILPRRKMAYLQMQLVCSLDSQHVFAITNLFLIFSKLGLSPRAANKLNLEALVEEVWNRWSRPLNQVWPPAWQWWIRSPRACWRTSAPRGQRRQPRPEGRWSARPCRRQFVSRQSSVLLCYRLSSASVINHNLFTSSLCFNFCNVITPNYWFSCLIRLNI